MVAVKRSKIRCDRVSDKTVIARARSNRAAGRRFQVTASLLVALGLAASILATSLRAESDCPNLFKRDPSVGIAERIEPTDGALIGRGDGVLVATVEEAVDAESTRYVVMAGDTPPIYEGTDIAEMLTALQTIGGDSTIYLNLHGFDSNRAAAFDTSVQLRKHQLAGAAEVTVLNRATDHRQIELLFEKRPAIGEVTVSPPREVGGGKYSGTIDFTHRAVRFVIEVVAGSAESVAAFLSRLQFWLQKVAINDLCMAEMVRRIKLDLAKEQGVSKEDIVVTLRDQLGAVQIGSLP